LGVNTPRTAPGESGRPCAGLHLPATSAGDADCRMLSARPLLPVATTHPHPPTPSFLGQPGSHEGKTVIVTGANSGIGYAAASALAAAGASVLMVCRSAARGEEAVARVKAGTGTHGVSLEVCDVSSLESIKGEPLGVV
jgi:hypothetical protein